MPDRRSLKFYQADVFSGEPFGGNPVAVFPDAGGLTDDQLQQIAREMNLSETVFVFPPTDKAAVVKLRIFTPTQEIPFAGHPVLGTFFILAELGIIPVKESITRVMQECNIGLFPVELHAEDGLVERVVMTQPKPEFLGPVEDVEDLYKVASALGLAKHVIADMKWPIEVVSTGLPVMIVPVRTLTAVRSIRPDASAITDVCRRFGANGIMVFTTVTVEPTATVHARMFAPSIGILEDPATGSASGALGAYLVQNRVVEVTPTTEIVVEQGYEIERPSQIFVRVESDDDIIQTIKVGGQCVMVVEGTLKF
ncbi:MAG: PhzF family phenazine biosynthesis protein [Nitrospirota bacterium]|nr:PhzF family phenazine biosynthesis protein [Nitrospirota bacterium]MDP2383467.1 PhzF family phenazine biosynthesis protein [Nitrospirota bacterium]MDP3598341.1 PhzF family phenazine biosynthesis protein [Nitrospirota bacterium]